MTDVTLSKRKRVLLKCTKRFMVDKIKNLVFIDTPTHTGEIKLLNLIV